MTTASIPQQHEQPFLLQYSDPVQCVTHATLLNHCSCTLHHKDGNFCNLAPSPPPGCAPAAAAASAVAAARKVHIHSPSVPTIVPLRGSTLKKLPHQQREGRSFR